MGKADCHIHMLFDGVDWKNAINNHRQQPDMALIRRRLADYAGAGYTYLRDGGDRWGVGAAARELAPEFGITYRTPLAPMCHAGHYGAFIGEKFEDLGQFAKMVKQHRAAGADFIKVMISGLMDFDRFGRLTEPGLDPEEIGQIVRIVHDAGMAVMLHGNGARTVEAAARAGADSIEHGAYLDEAAMAAMAENGTIWCPTVATIGNLRGKGRFDEENVAQIFGSAQENLRRFAQLGGIIAPGSDAGAWAVPHVQGSQTEYRLLEQTLGESAAGILRRGAEEVKRRF